MMDIPSIVTEMVSNILMGDITVWVVVIVLVLLWMFKVIRDKYVKNNDNETERIDKVIDAYSDVMYQIQKSIMKNDFFENEMFLCVKKNYKFLSLNICEKWNCYIESYQDDSNELKKKLHLILMNLHNEIIELKKEQNNRIDLLKKNFISYHLKYLGHIVAPIVITCSPIIYLLGSYLLATYLLDPMVTNLNKSIAVAFILEVILIILTLYLVYCSLSERKFRHGKLSWILFVVNIIIFFVSLYISWIAILGVFSLISLLVYYKKKEILNG